MGNYPLLGFSIKDGRVRSGMLRRDRGDVAELSVSVSEPVFARQHLKPRHVDVNHYRLTKSVTVTVRYPDGSVKRRDLTSGVTYKICFAKGHARNPSARHHHAEDVPNGMADAAVRQASQAMSEASRAMAARQSAARDARLAARRASEGLRAEQLRLMRVQAILEVPCSICSAPTGVTCTDIMASPIAQLDQGVLAHFLRIQRAVETGTADREATLAQFGRDVVSVPESLL
jgi:hypothetical protein